MTHHCEHEAAAPLLFTAPTGEIFQLSRADFAAAFPPTPRSDCQDPTTTPVIQAVPFNLSSTKHVDRVDGSQDAEPATAVPLLYSQPLTSSIHNISCSSSSPLIEIVSREELLLKRATSILDEHMSKSTGESPRASEEQSLGNVLKVSMVYNEYGELVSSRDIHRQPDPSDLSVTQLLRLIKKAYRHENRDKLGHVFAQELHDRESCLAARAGIGFVKERLSLWVLRKLSEPKSRERDTSIEVYKGPARVLDIGCGDGNWCFKVKLARPDWIVERVDDTDHWLCVNKDVLIQDSIQLAQGSEEPNDTYFGGVHTTQERPKFTVRNINNLLAHPRPMAHNLYGIIRGRDIFDRVESYKSFLEDVRLLLQPGGVVEFVEIDPRPRAVCVKVADGKGDHKSRSYTNWTDKISDRFKDAREQELATTVPGWTARVEERLKATLRPRDGVAAPQLKSWLEGAGFWDVSQTVAQIPVGSNARSGQLLKELLLYQIALENEIPKLRQELPEIELDQLEHGGFYLNLHIITGRKPKDPRPGDLLSDGTRQEMTNSIHDRVARFTGVKHSQWERFDFDGKLPTIMENLAALQDNPPLRNNPFPRKHGIDHYHQ